MTSEAESFALSNIRCKSEVFAGIILRTPVTMHNNYGKTESNMLVMSIVIGSAKDGEGGVGDEASHIGGGCRGGEMGRVR